MSIEMLYMHKKYTKFLPLDWFSAISSGKIEIRILNLFLEGWKSFGQNIYCYDDLS